MDIKEEVLIALGSFIMQGGGCRGQKILEGRVGAMGLAIGSCETAEWGGQARGLCAVCEIDTSMGGEERVEVGSIELRVMLGAGRVSKVDTIGMVVAWFVDGVASGGAEVVAVVEGSMDVTGKGGVGIAKDPKELGGMGGGDEVSVVGGVERFVVGYGTEVVGRGGSMSETWLVEDGAMEVSVTSGEGGPILEPGGLITEFWAAGDE